MTAATAAAQTHALPPSKALALQYILKDEGGYAERALEGGGAVNMGITFTVFSAWRKQHGVKVSTFEDLKAMSVAEACEIYAHVIFAPIRFDDLPPGVDYVIADSATNNGFGGATRFLGIATGHPHETHFDGVLFWAATHQPPATLINAFCDARAAGQKRFKNYSAPTKPGGTTTFGMVWDRRVSLVRQRALGMLKGAK